MQSTPDHLVTPALSHSMSPPRFATYRTATLRAGRSVEDTPLLYAWNAHVSGALLIALHMCEVAIRNAVNDALIRVYGSHWPWDRNFENSLPSPKGSAYQPRLDLTQSRSRSPNADRVVVGLTFKFWEKMFTSRHDSRVWNPHLLTLFPNLDKSQPVALHRLRIATDLESIRRLRNRIAHHEPIFMRDLTNDLSTAHELIRARCQVSADWMMNEQKAAHIIRARPF